jgi:hypothetical protein
MKTSSLSVMWWLVCCVVGVLAEAAVAQMPRNFLEKANRLILCEDPTSIEEGRVTHKLTKHVVAKGAACAALLDKLDKGKDAVPPATGLGFFAYLAVVDRSGFPMMVFSVRCESGITSIHNCAQAKGVPSYRAGGDELAIKVSPEFTRAIYDFLKKNRLKEIAAHEKFYTSIGTSLEEMLFADGAQKLIEKSKK